MGLGFSSSKSSGSSTPRDPGTGVMGGLQNFLFNAPQRLSQGQFLLGGPGSGFTGSVVDPQPKKKRGFMGKMMGMPTDMMDKGLSMLGGGGNDADTLTTKQFDELKKREGLTQANLDSFARFLPIMDLIGIDSPGLGGGHGEGFLDRTNQRFDTAEDSLMGLIRDGGLIDTSALVDRGITDLKERFSGLGGLFGTDIQSEGLRLGSEFEIGARESAMNRQLQAIGLNPSLVNSRFDFNRQFIADTTPEGQAAQLFAFFGNPQSTDQFSPGADEQNKSKEIGGNIGFYEIRVWLALQKT